MSHETEIEYERSTAEYNVITFHVLGKKIRLWVPKFTGCKTGFFKAFIDIIENNEAEALRSELNKQREINRVLEDKLSRIRNAAQ